MRNHYQAHLKWCVKTDALNGKIREYLIELDDRLWNLATIRRESFVQNSDNWNAYTEEHMRPLIELQRRVRWQSLCTHRHVDEGADVDYCLDCGAANYGIGWVFEDTHAHTVAHLEAASA